MINSLQNISPQKLERICKKIGDSLGYDFTSREYLYKDESQEWITEETTFISNKIKLQHLRGEKTLSLPVFKHTKFIHVDVDKSSSIPIVVFNLGNKPVFLERNPENDHYHIFFLFDEYINTKGKREIEYFFKVKYGIQISITDHNQFFRLPFSKEYSERGFYNPETSNYIDQIDDLEVCVDSFRLATPTSLSEIMDIKNEADGTTIPFVRKDPYTGKVRKAQAFPKVQDFLYTNQDVRLLENEADLEEYLKIVYRGMKFGKIGGKVEKEYIQDAITMYWFLLQKQSYDRISDRKYKHKNPKYQILNDKASFSYDFSQSLFKESFRIKRNVRRVLFLLENAMLVNRVQVNGYTKSYSVYLHSTHYHCHSINMNENQARKQLWNLTVTGKVFFDNLEYLSEEESNEIRRQIHCNSLSGKRESHWGMFSDKISRYYKDSNKELSNLFSEFSTIKSCSEYLNLKFPYPIFSYKKFLMYKFNRYSPEKGMGDIISIPQGYEHVDTFQLLMRENKKKSKGFYDIKEYLNTVGYYIYPVFENNFSVNKSTVYYKNYNIPNMDYKKLIYIPTFININTTFPIIKVHKLYTKKNLPQEAKILHVNRSQLKIPIIMREYPQYPQGKIKYKTEREIIQELIAKKGLK